MNPTSPPSQAKNRALRIDASEIAAGLWQGSAPREGPRVAEAGFGTLVLCAQEYQPAASEFPGVTVLYVPLADTVIDCDIWNRAVTAAAGASDARAAGQAVLVTCAAGLNRSGLVSALSLVLLDRLTGAQAVSLVRSRRYGALCNMSFADALMEFAKQP